MNTNTPSTESKFFDLITRGCAYLNRVRQVKPAKGKPFYAVTLACLHGDADNDGKVDKTYVDCNVTGQANDVFDALFEAHPGVEELSAEKAIRLLAGVTFSDMTLRTFVYQSGERKGETGATIKARLIGVSFMKVDGEDWYNQPKPDTASSDASTDQNDD